MCLQFCAQLSFSRDTRPPSSPRAREASESKEEAFAERLCGQTLLFILPFALPRPDSVGPESSTSAGRIMVELRKEGEAGPGCPKKAKAGCVSSFHGKEEPETRGNSQIVPASLPEPYRPHTQLGIVLHTQSELPSAHGNAQPVSTSAAIETAVKGFQMPLHRPSAALIGCRRGVPGSFRLDFDSCTESRSRHRRWTKRSRDKSLTLNGRGTSRLAAHTLFCWRTALCGGLSAFRDREPLRGTSPGCHL
ncbi:hypothetical protein B0J14DRAFT_558722 [Halenospora varia]|nr:hypothetical protein B0J14DRAFT_558722 [Halenospora varia]